MTSMNDFELFDKFEVFVDYRPSIQGVAQAIKHSDLRAGKKPFRTFYRADLYFQVLPALVHDSCASVRSHGYFVSLCRKITRCTRNIIDTVPADFHYDLHIVIWYCSSNDIVSNNNSTNFYVS